MPTTFRIDLAKSGRASCRKCKAKIDKGVLRIASVSESSEGYDMVKWVHIGCFAMPRRFTQGAEKCTVEEFVEDHLEDATDEKEILPDRKDEVVAAIEEAVANTGSAKKKAAGSTGDPYIESLKAAFEAQNEPDEGKGKGKKTKGKRKKSGDDDEEEDEKPAAKKAKKNGKSTGDVSAQEIELYGKLHKLNANALKDILRWNRQVLKGTKGVIFHKVMDGAMNGRIALCGVCGGKLKINEETFKTVTCNGRFDEDTQVRIPCDVSYKIEEAPRVEPWFMEEPTEEENAELDRLEAEARGEELEGAEVDENSPLGQLLAAGKDLKLDFSGKDKIRASTKKLLTLLKENGKLDLPKEESTLRQDVGRLVLSMTESTTEEILKKVAKHFGFAEKKAAKAVKKEAAMASACAEPKNAPLIMAFQELASLYFKHGNTNAGATYKKVVAALNGLDFEVTAGNAKSLAKSGPTKVQNIGGTSAKLMVEFLKTGKMEKLEEKRALEG